MRISIIAILISLSAICYAQTDSIGFHLQEGWIIIDQGSTSSSYSDMVWSPIENRLSNIDWKEYEVVNTGDTTCLHHYITKTTYRISTCSVMHYDEMCDQDIDYRDCICKKCNRYVKEKQVQIFVNSHTEEPDFFELLKMKINDN